MATTTELRTDRQVFSEFIQECLGGVDDPGTRVMRTALTQLEADLDDGFTIEAAIKLLDAISSLSGDLLEKLDAVRLQLRFPPGKELWIKILRPFDVRDYKSNAKYVPMFVGVTYPVVVAASLKGHPPDEKFIFIKGTTVGWPIDHWLEKLELAAGDPYFVIIEEIK